LFSYIFSLIRWSLQLSPMESNCLQSCMIPLLFQLQNTSTFEFPYIFVVEVFFLCHLFYFPCVLVSYVLILLLFNLFGSIWILSKFKCKKFFKKMFFFVFFTVLNFWLILIVELVLLNFFFYWKIYHKIFKHSFLSLKLLDFLFIFIVELFSHFFSI